ncbi:MAG: hypothetical protein GXO64_00610 [Candidatus Micrarchaeota archaeon]|nr:hypothetical protein [Candidatus Micrarchaeota archaeon]
MALILDGKSVDFERIRPDRLRKLVGNLATYILESGYRPDSIVYIVRGGMIIARYMGDYLDVDKITQMRIKKYGNKTETSDNRPVLLEEIGISIEGDNVLLCEDVSDNGGTLTFAKNYLKMKKPKEIRIATVYTKPWTKFHPDYSVGETDKWIIFPGEEHEIMRKVMHEYCGEEGLSDDKLYDLLSPHFSRKEIGNYIKMEKLRKK